jgi:hypothetical protein
VGLAHGGLQVQRFDILPSLLQQGNQEIDGQHGVGDDLVLVHVDVTDGTSETEDLLQLELDGGPDLDELLGEVVRVGDRGGELSSCECVREWQSAGRPFKMLGVTLDSPLERPGPSKRGICLIKASEAKKASYFLASFLTSFLFLLSLDKTSEAVSTTFPVHHLQTER